ncbi:MAG: hypothetical protein OXD50_02600 [Chloroflexi bacterium]|nr:hypothetical protein [Chloroflexota bacterium]
MNDYLNPELAGREKRVPNSVDESVDSIPAFERSERAFNAVRGTTINLQRICASSIELVGDDANIEVLTKHAQLGESLPGP